MEVIEEAVANIPGMDLGDSLVEDFDLDFCFDSVEQLANSSPQKSLLNRYLLSFVHFVLLTKRGVLDGSRPIEIEIENVLSVETSF